MNSDTMNHHAITGNKDDPGLSDIDSLDPIVIEYARGVLDKYISRDSSSRIAAETKIAEILQNIRVDKTSTDKAQQFIDIEVAAREYLKL